MKYQSPKFLLIFLCIGGLLTFTTSISRLKKVPYSSIAPEIQVSLPLFVQVGMSAGDRYLAANIDSVRALVTSTSQMKPEEYALLAKVQKDASWLNPAHEDNYYIAAAILPWYGQLDAAQTILRRATFSRPTDYQPAFLYAFHLFYFNGDAAGAAEWLRRAAINLPDDDERLLMENLAAKWADKAANLDTAINVVSTLAKQAKRKDFRTYLEMRAQRLRDLKMLRSAADTFIQLKGRRLNGLDELVSSGVLVSLPKDPFNFGFVLTPTGEINLKSGSEK